MNEEKEIKRLTWKYFWQQKWDECKDYICLLGILFSWIVVFFILMSAEFNPTNWQGAVVIIIFSILIISIPTFVTIATIRWFRSNWEKASMRAHRKINRRVKEDE